MEMRTSAKGQFSGKRLCSVDWTSFGVTVGHLFARNKVSEVVTEPLNGKWDTS